jgi:hypothetical protein
MAKSNKANGLLKYKLLFQYADCASVLWRLAKASHMMATVYGTEGNNDKKKEFVFQGLFMMCDSMYHISD